MHITHVNGKSVIKQQVLGLQKFTWCYNATRKLQSKFHGLWSSFSPLLSFILLNHACNKPRAKETFHISHHTHSIDLFKRSLMQLSLSILDFSVILYDFSKFKTEIIHINPRSGTYT